MPFNNNQLLDIQVKTMQSFIPKKVKFRGKDVELTREERLATGRAIWFVIKKGYGLSTATCRASGSSGVNTTKIERATRMSFPVDYFSFLQISKNCETVKEIV